MIFQSPDPEELLRVPGFDPEGEAVVQQMPDGSLWLILNCMPPSDAADSEAELFNEFGLRLQEAIGVPVVWDDRERFVVPAPREDTPERIAQFLTTCRRGRSSAAAKKAAKSPRAATLSRLGDLFQPAGFRRGKGSSFSRSIPQGRQVVSMAWIDRKPECQFTLTLGIRLDAVEELAIPLLGIPPDYTAETLTTLTQLEHFGLKPQLGLGVWFHAANSAELDAAFQQLTPVIQGQILPFLDRYQTLATVAGALNAPRSLLPASSQREGMGQRLAGMVGRLFSRNAAPASETTSADAAWAKWRQERSAFDTTQHPARAVRHLLMAYLVGDPHLEERIHTYEAELAHYTAPDREILDSAIRFIHRSKDQPSP